VPAYEYAHPDDLLDRAAEADEPPLIVALDGVTDPRNLGAVVRSAAAFGAHGVVIPERRAAGMTAVGVEDVAPAPRPASRSPRRSTWSASSRPTRTPAAWSSAWLPTATSRCPT
jgi:23S rRNA (guanosine2251-2'-O)-methyltransferase